MSEIADYTSKFIQGATRTLSKGVAKVAKLPSEISQIPKDVFTKANEAEQTIVHQVDQLRKYARSHNGNSASSQKPSPSSSSGQGFTVRIKREPKSRLVDVHVRNAKAQLPGGGLMEKAGLYHQWIDGPGISAGMGNMRGVPGENGQTSPDMPFSPTQVVNHHGRKFQKSQFVHGLDSGALKAWTQEGRRTGPWTPLLNDCNSYVRETIKNSTPRDVIFHSVQDALPGGFEGSRDPFKMPAAPAPLRNVVIFPDGTYHKAATSY